jgi:hypothetical protein
MHMLSDGYSLLTRKPHEHEYRGLSYEAASVLMQEICRQAAGTGQTVMASYHLDELRKVVEAK